MDYEDAKNYINNKYMSMMNNQATLGNQLGAGLLGSVHPARIDSSISGVFSPQQINKVAHVTVERLENGWMLRLGTKAYQAADTDDLQKIFIAALVAAQLESK